MTRRTAGRLLVPAARALLAARLVGGVHDGSSANGVELADARLDQSESTGTSIEYFEVYLLVQRHGLSCTNICEKWGFNLDAGRSAILDPLTAGAAHNIALSARADVEAWLSNHSLTVDARVSSVLARAIETGALTFPSETTSFPESAQCVVPYIREDAKGKGNQPKDQDAQVESVVESLSTHRDLNVKLDYRWVNLFGREEHSHTKFERFLQQSFLPDLVTKRNKKSGETLVVAVVTHSNFMKNWLKDRCKHLWESQNGAEKPLNNQVLVVPYRFKITKYQSTVSADWTPNYELTRREAPYDWPDRNEDKGACRQAFAGQSEYEHRPDRPPRTRRSQRPLRKSMSIPSGLEKILVPQRTESLLDLEAVSEHSLETVGKDLTPLCYDDIGDSCHGPIQSSCLTKSLIYNDLLEARILKLAEEIAKKERKNKRPKEMEAASLCSATRPSRECLKIKGKRDKLAALLQSDCYGQKKPNMQSYITWKYGDTTNVDGKVLELVELATEG